MRNEDLVAEIQAGRRELLGALWEQVERFIRRQANQRPDIGAVDREDLYQSGYLALVAAVDSYTPERDMKFVSWLAYHLKTAFNEASNYRSERQRRDPMHQADSLSRPLDDEDGGELLDIVADPHGLQGLKEAEERIWREELAIALEKALTALPEAESDALRRRYYRGQTMAQIARETGKTAYEVQKEEQRGLAALRKPSSGLRAYIEENTPYYLHVGATRFNSTQTSAVEEIVFRREGMETRRG
ncbi:MAG: sigma-70 family RNA polymerase sigma factor [Oscillospiraceae bacterium]|jgi:RNA polymerase sigma factor (sigma-70 family)|nr:sigma-70 family RNA polymerase sigma factor [Oscillospiraceae bacterium]